MQIGIANNPLENFSASNFEQCFNVTIIDDTAFEDEEEFTVAAFFQQIGTPDPVTVSPDRVTIQIKPSDGKIPVRHVDS